MPEIAAVDAGHGGGAQGGTTATTESAYRAPAFRRNYFVTEEGQSTEGKVSNPKAEQWRRREKKAAPSEWVQFSDESRGALSGFLKDHIKNIHDMSKNQPGALPEEDRELLKLFGADGGSALDQDAVERSINEKLNDPRTWELGMERWRYVQMLKRIALGARTETRLNMEDELTEDNKHYLMPQGERRIMDRGDRKARRLTKEQVDREGFVHKFGREKIMPNWEDVRDFLIKPGILGGVNLTALKAGHPEIAVLVTGGAIAWSAVDSGQKLRDVLKPYGEAFKVLVNDKKLASYVQHITGERIDPHDYKINPATGKLELDSSKPVHNSLNVESLIKDIKSGQEAMNRFYRELGIKDYHASPEEFIFRMAEGKSTHREPAPTRLAKRIKDIMETEAKFVIKDPKDVAGNLKKYMGARTKAMMEMIGDLSEDLMKGKAEPRTGQVAEKITAREKDGRVFKKRAEDFAKSQEKLRADKTRLTESKAALVVYEEALRPLHADRDAVETILTDTLRGAFGTPDDALVALEALANDETSTTNVIIEGKPYRPVAAALKANDQWLSDELGKIDSGTGPWAQGPKEKIEAYQARIASAYTAKATEHKRREDRIIADLDKIDEVVEKINDAQKKIKQTKESLSESNQQVIKATEVIKGMEDDFREITGWKIKGIDQVALRTLSPDELLEIINKANSSKKTVGWKESENDTNRQKLLNAIAEARAQHQESLDPKVTARKSGGYDLLRAGGADQYSLSDHFLRISSFDEIRKRVDDMKAANGALPDISNDHIKNALLEAENKFQIRLQACDSTTIGLEEAITKQQEKIDKIAETLKPETDKLRLVQTLMARRRTHISDKVYQMSNDIGKYVDTAKITAASTEYTPVEKKAGAEAGYYALLDFMFDYKNGTSYTTKDKDGSDKTVHETRDEYFQRLNALLPPDTLAELIYKSIYPKTKTGTTIDMNKLLTDIQKGLSRQTLTFRDLRRGFSGMIDKLYAQEVAVLD